MYFWVFLGGGLGSMARYGLSRMIQPAFPHINPVATLLSNVVSTIILGIILYFIALKPDFPQSVKTMLVVGFCGGFSTFSTFGYETFELLRMGNYFFAVINILISILLVLVVLYILTKVISYDF